jgi:protein phosphatase
VQVFAKTDKGKVRSINQDAFYINTLSDGAVLAVVCDGMGGASAGDIASKTAVEIISQYVLNA